MNLYDRHILPRIVNCVCGLKPMMRQREKIIPDAKGIILELGIGSGLNIPFYNLDKVTHLIGIDPSPHKKALSKALSKSDISHEMMYKSAEKLEMEDDSIDTVVSTYTLCTIPDLDATLSECRRVLKPNGCLRFVEHGLSPDPSVSKTQNFVNPIWKPLAGGCHLNRDIPAILKKHGFEIRDSESLYLPGWKPAAWNVLGMAVVG